MKNHYVSQLILKRFANALYIFDDNAKSISKHTQTENIFYKKDIYTDEVETAMNFNLENDFAKLLDNYIYKYFKDDGSKCSVSPFKWLDHYALMALKDTRQNKYILQHLLDNEKSVLTMKNFDFMGSPAQRIELIKADLRKLS